jgi:pteridine reductase
MNVKNKTVLITGSAVRIGRAIALRLAEDGAHVCIHYNASEQPARALEQTVQAMGQQAWVVQGDLTSESGCKSVMSQALSLTGGLDVLVNNASVFGKHTLEESDMEAVMGEYWTNLFAPMQLMRLFAAQDRSGAIVNMLDRRITSLDTACVPYVLAKKSLAELTRIAALHWAPRIRVNGVAPGAILPPPGKDGNYLKDHAGRIPLDTPCTPEDVAEAVRFTLVSSTMTGQIVYVDGGQHLLSEV